MAYAPGALTRRLARDRVRLGLLWFVMLAWPLVAPNEYVLSLGVMFFINLMLVASLNLVLGYAGQISLCHGAFFGLGAYVSGVLSVRYGVTPALGMLAAIVGTTIAAVLIALPTLRLRGHYLAMGTLGFNAILTVLFTELVPLTGGPNGLAGIAPLSIFGWELDTPKKFFFFAWLATGIVMLLILNLVAGRIGRGLRAIAGSEIAAGALGIDTFRFKVAAFSLSAGFAGARRRAVRALQHVRVAGDVQLLHVGAAGGDGRPRRLGQLLGPGIRRADLHRDARTAAQVPRRRAVHVRVVHDRRAAVPPGRGRGAVRPQAEARARRAERGGERCRCLRSATSACASAA